MIELFEINFTCFGVEHWLKHGSGPRNAFGLNSEVCQCYIAFGEIIENFGVILVA